MSDYAQFADPAFNAHAYVHSVLAKTGEQAGGYTTDPDLAKEDIAIAISRLDHGVEDIGKQLKHVVYENHEALLDKAASVSDMEGSVKSIRKGLDELNLSVDKLRQKIHTPYQSLSQNIIRLRRLQLASDALRRTARFILLSRRLEVQMRELTSSKKTDGIPTTNGTNVATAAVDEGEREGNTLTKMALTVAELESFLSVDEPVAKQEGSQAADDEDVIPLQYIAVVADQIPALKSARQTVETEMDALVTSGLADLSQSRLASGLQTAHNLHILPTLVQNLIDDLTRAVSERLKLAFDMSKISKEASKGQPPQSSSSLLYKSRVRTEPTNLTAPQFTNALWTRLETLIEELVGCCIKVYTLEKVLKSRKDSATQITFLDKVMKVLDSKPSTIFWDALARSLEKQCRDAIRGSTFLQQTLGQGYPRFLRLFQDFFSRIALHTDTVYTETQQSTETILVLRSLAPFEKLYLSRSTSKLNEVIAQSFSGGAKSPPSMGEGMSIARSVANELDAARFDPFLLRSVAHGANSALQNFIERVDKLVVKDRTASTFVGTLVTSQQLLNAQLATTLYHCWSRLHRIQSEYTESIASLLSGNIQRIEGGFQSIVSPIVAGLKRDINNIISRVHKLDFGKSLEERTNMGGASLYMKDLSEKLAFIRSDVLAPINTGDTNRERLIAIAAYTVRAFLFHTSIIKPLGESGKLQLTSDMTELEFALDAFVADSGQNKTRLTLNDLGSDYQALRAMRTMLFLDNESLAHKAKTAGATPLMILHHIIVRSPLELPHRSHGWQQAEYVAWLEEHTQEEALMLIQGDLTHWEQKQKASSLPQDETSNTQEFLTLARTVLDQAHQPT